LSARTKVGQAFGKAAVFLLSYALLASAPAAAHGPIAAHRIAIPGGGNALPHHLAPASTQSSRSEIRLGSQGEVLEKAGAILAACAAYEQAIATIDGLPKRHRDNESTSDLEACLKGALLQLRR
jgi:hypothetical protein